MARDHLGRFTKLGEKVERNSHANTVRLAATILQAVVVGTPVDTGHARANWQIGINQIPDNELDEEDQGGQATISKGNATLATRQPEQKIYLANNVPYIGRLNAGWSAQAPSGYIERAVNTAVQAFKTWKVVK